MEKTEGKIRYGLIGIGAQGGSYARFLTNAPAPFPGMVCAPCPDNCALGAPCTSSPSRGRYHTERPVLPGAAKAAVSWSTRLPISSTCGSGSAVSP